MTGGFDLGREGFGDAGCLVGAAARLGAAVRVGRTERLESDTGGGDQDAVGASVARSGSGGDARIA